MASKKDLVEICRLLYPNVELCEHGKDCGACWAPEDMADDMEAIRERIKELTDSERKLEKIQGSLNAIRNLATGLFQA